MSKLLKDVVDAVNPFQKQGPVSQFASGHRMSTKYLSSMIGTAGAGKTVIANQIFLQARTLQQQIDDFFCDVDDTNSTIMNDICRMESGHFPPKTRAYNSYAYQTALHMWWGKNSIFGQKSATFQVCDIAGEDMVAQSQYSTKKPDKIAYSQAAKLVDYIYRSDIFIPVAPASRAPLFDGDTTLEAEDPDKLFNPDVRLANILGMLFSRRKANRNPIKGIALCLSKCDMVDKYVEKKHGWNLYNSAQDRVDFLNKYFPWTTMKLKALTDTWSQTEVEIFPMFVETKKDSDGNQKKWQEGSDAGNPIIDVEDRVIKHNAQACVNLINFVGRLVG